MARQVLHAAALARAFGVDRSTATRWVQAAHAEGRADAGWTTVVTGKGARRLVRGLVVTVPDEAMQGAA